MDLNAVKIPPFATTAGNTLPVGKTRHGFQICVQNATVEECRAYAQTLETAGFALYAANEVPAGSEEPCHINLFYTYTRPDVYVFLSWNASLHTARITLEPPQALPPAEKPVLTDRDVIVPAVTLLQLDSGMSCVIHLPDGSFIIIDGGVYKPEDARRLHSFLVGNTREGSKPVIASWMFTHPHSDHIGLAAAFIREYAANIDIRAFAYQFPDARWMDTSLESETEKAGVARLEKSIADFFPEAIIYTLHTGQIYSFKGVAIEILCTGDDIYPAVPVTYNDVSAAWRIRFEGGKTVMILGDCMHRECRQLAHTYGDYLKSDILQLAHHGLIGGDKKLYQLIDPEICLWTIRESRFLGTQGGQTYQWCLGEGGCDYNAWIRDENVRLRRHYHQSTTTTVPVQAEEDGI